MVQLYFTMNRQKMIDRLKRQHFRQTEARTANIAFILFFLFVVFANSQAQSDSVAILIAKLNSKTITDGERNILKTTAFEVQNRGQLLDESSHDYKGALLLTDSAIKIFNALKDTLSEANNIL